MISDGHAGIQSGTPDLSIVGFSSVGTLTLRPRSRPGQRLPDPSPPTRTDGSTVRRTGYGTGAGNPRQLRQVGYGHGAGGWSSVLVGTKPESGASASVGKEPGAKVRARPGAISDQGPRLCPSEGSRRRAGFPCVPVPVRTTPGSAITVREPPSTGPCAAMITVHQGAAGACVPLARLSRCHREAPRRVRATTFVRSGPSVRRGRRCPSQTQPSALRGHVRGARGAVGPGVVPPH